MDELDKLKEITKQIILARRELAIDNAAAEYKRKPWVYPKPSLDDVDQPEYEDRFRGVTFGGGLYNHEK